MVFVISPNLLPKTDKRYKKWRESLKKRPAPWSKGFTKKTHPSVAKISETFKNKKIDNFAKWRKKQIKLGLIRGNYPKLEKSGDLAELIGVILGDGHIEKFPRTESITIVSNAQNKGFIKRYTRILKKLFLTNRVYVKDVGKNKGGTRIRIFQKFISKRLDIPTGSRGSLNLTIPDWILKDKYYLRRYLRGLYEAEGSASIHEPTYTYKFLFSNKNQSLLNNVYTGMKILGFNPHRSKDKIQISKKIEFFEAIEILEFRKY